MTTALQILISCVAGYLLGSVPFGYIVFRLVKGKDIRHEGNKRIGAANVFREAGPLFGIIVGLLDILKGSAVGIVIVLLLNFPSWMLALGAVAAMAGHIWPVFLKFKGGEGMSVVMGVYFFFAPAVMGVLYGLYFLFLIFWKLRIRPFYLYHAFNWQTIFWIGCGIVWLCGEGWITDHSGLSLKGALMCAAAMSAAGTLRQIQIHGLTFILKPADFNNKYTRKIDKKS